MIMPVRETRSRWYRDPAVVDLTRHMDQVEQESMDANCSPWELLSPAEIRAVEGELRKCRQDFVYAARNYFWIADDRGNETPFCLWDSQEIIYAKMLELKAQSRPQKIVIIKSRRLGCCLDPGTKVLTSDLRWIRLDDVKVGQELVAVDEGCPGGQGNQRKFRKAVTLARRDVYEKAYRITMDNGETLIATGEHRFLCKRRAGTEAIWRSVKKQGTKKSSSPIVVGDEIRWITNTWSDNSGYEDGWFGGMIDGEGSMRARDRQGCEINVSQTENSAQARAIKYVQDRGYRYQLEICERQKTDGLNRKPLTKVCISGMDDIFRILGTTRPSRFINNDWWEGKVLPKSGHSWGKVVSIEELPAQRMIDLQTSTQTFIANGFVSHNSTLIEALIAWDTMFFTNRTGVVVSYDRDHTKDLLGIMLRIYDKCPWWMKPRVSSRTFEGGLVFDNPDYDMRRSDPGTQSKVMLKSANSISGVGQGYRISAAHLSEWTSYGEFLARQIIEEDLAYALQPDSIAFLESTAKGANNFSHRFWKRCEELAEDSQWYPLFLPWFVDRTHVLMPRPNQYYDPEVIEMRDKAADEWVRCSDEKCRKYYNRWKRRVDQTGSTCPGCRIGILDPLTLTDEQLAWIQDLRRNAKDDEDSQKNLAQEQAHCVTGDSRVSTNRGIIKIEDASGVRLVETGNVHRWLDQGLGDTMIVSTNLGRIVKCTPDHRFLLSSGEWRQAKDLLPNDSVALSPPSFASDYHTAQWEYCPTCTMSIRINEDWGRFLGYFMGDGCLMAAGVKITMDRKDVDLVEDVCALIERIIGTRPVVTHRNGRTDVRSSNVLWRRILEGLALIAPYECRSWRRVVHVPDCIWRSPRSVVRQFLSALIECDGHAYRETPKTVFFTKWDQFARDVQLLLLGFGINSKISLETKRKKNDSGDGFREYHGSNVQMKSEASNAFHREVGFISDRKRTSACVRPSKRLGAFENKMEDSIRSVMPSARERVYDLTVLESHRFGCNGVMVHNSAEVAFQVTGYQVFGKVAQDFANSTVRHPILSGFFDQNGRIHAVDPKRVKFHPDSGHMIQETIHCIVEECKEDHSHDTCPLRIWEYPDPTARYYIGADVSEGLGGNCDYSVGAVIRMAGGAGIGPTYQVASWRSNRTGTQDFAEELAKLGRYYNEAEISVEVNKYDTVLTWLRSNIQYPNLYRWKHMDSINVMSNKLGWYTNQLSRPRMHQNFRRFLEYKMFYVRSAITAEEMKNFVKDDYGDRVAGADSDSHDDELIALMIALWCAYEGMFDETRGYIPLSKQSLPDECAYMVQCVVCGHKDYTNFIPMEGEQNIKCGDEKCGSIRVVITPTKAFKGTQADPKQLLREIGALDYDRGQREPEYWEL